MERSVHRCPLFQLGYLLSYSWHSLLRLSCPDAWPQEIIAAAGVSCRYLVHCSQMRSRCGISITLITLSTEMVIYFGLLFCSCSYSHLLTMKSGGVSGILYKQCLQQYILIIFEICSMRCPICILASCTGCKTSARLATVSKSLNCTFWVP